jgi:putative restriction endonuclease
MANWTREQVLLAFELYCRTSFGRIHHRNPAIIALAEQIGRTPDAVAMKMLNLSSFDPAEQARGIRGLTGASQLDRAIFDEFSRRQDALIEAATTAAQVMGIAPPPAADSEPLDDDVEEAIATFAGPTEMERVTRVRRAQGAFRRAVLASYESHCAICRMALPAMLCASHIIPWRHDESRRADPTNGLALCALHDRAFDRGLITVNDDLRIVVSPRAQPEDSSALPPLHRVGLVDVAGQSLYLPRRFHPDPAALSHHRLSVFAA